MGNVHFTYVRKEAAIQGQAKSRLHLYDYQGPVGKDPFAIAAKKIEGKSTPRLNCIQKMFFVLVEVKSGEKSDWYMVNIRSAIKRSKVTGSELKSLSPLARGILLGNKVLALSGESNISKENKEANLPKLNKSPEKPLSETTSSTPEQANKTASAASSIPVQAAPTVQVETAKETALPAPADNLDSIKEFFGPEDWNFLKETMGKKERLQEGGAKLAEELKNKSDVASLTRLGVLYDALGQNKEAQEAFTKALQECPFYVEAVREMLEAEAKQFEEIVYSSGGPTRRQLKFEQLKEVQRLTSAFADMRARISSITGKLKAINDFLFLLPPPDAPKKTGIESLKDRYNEQEWRDLAALVGVVFQTPKEISQSIKNIEALFGASVLNLQQIDKLRCQKGRALLQLEGCEDQARQCFRQVTSEGLKDYTKLLDQQVNKLEALADSVSKGDDKVAASIIAVALIKWASLYTKIVELIPPVPGT